jgi:hypothetical protein
VDEHKIYEEQRSYFEELSTASMNTRLNREFYTDDELDQYYAELYQDRDGELFFGE